VPDSLTLVDSLGAAVAAMNRRVPEVVLISPLMPPDEEAELIERLRALPRTLYVQTLMTPDFAKPQEARSFRGLIRRRKTTAVSEPSEFANQLKAYLDVVRDERSDRAASPARWSAERRAALRAPATDGSTLTVNGDRVQLVDWSATGLQVLSSSLLVPGRVVDVEVRHGDRTVKSRAAVVWGTLDCVDLAVVGCRAGLHFTEHDALPEFAPVDAMEKPLLSGENTALVPRPESKTAIDRARRLRRDELPWISTVRVAGGSEARLLNLSSSGMLIETATKFAPGTSGTIQLDGKDGTLAVPVRFVRSEVVDVSTSGVKYVAAAAFDAELDLDELHVIAPIGDTTPKAVADWLKKLSSELYRGGDPAALQKRMKDGLIRLLSARDVEIRREPVPPPDGCDSIYFTIVHEQNYRAILQVTFNPGHTPSALDFKILRAATALATVLFSPV
jgi:hypothetical protein